MFFLSRMLANKLELPDPAHALPGRAKPQPTARSHHVFKRPLRAPVPPGFARAVFAMGNFQAAERLFWRTPGVWMTAAGYCGGYTPNPTYQEVCTGLTGHAESVLVDFDPDAVSYDALLRLFWEGHDPTQGMRQGADVGTAFRSVIFVADAAQRRAAEASKQAYGKALRAAGMGPITTGIAAAAPFFHAEAEHQQYLSKNPGANAPLAGTGVAFPASGG